MRITEMISEVDSLRPNHVDDTIKRKWLSEVESLLINEVVLTHEVPEWVRNSESYQKYCEINGRGNLFDDYSDSELLIPEPYGNDIYFWWLNSKIDLIERDTEKYSNDSQLYNNACLTYKDWYNRTYMPVQQTKSFMRGGRNNVFGTAKSNW